MRNATLHKSQIRRARKHKMYKIWCARMAEIEAGIERHKAHRAEAQTAYFRVDRAIQLQYEAIRAVQGKHTRACLESHMVNLRDREAMWRKRCKAHYERINSLRDELQVVYKLRPPKR